MCNKPPFYNKLPIFNKFRVCNIHSNSHSGGILIEFAFSIPILIILLLFACDHYRFYELKDKIKTSAYLAASMVQQITNTKSDKQLTKKDIARIMYASCLNFFHTNTMFKPWPFGIYYIAHFYYVKRLSSNEYLYQMTYSCFDSGNSPSNVPSVICNPLAKVTKSSIEMIHSDLICDKNGDERVFMECCYRKINFSKKKLGFFILNPQVVKGVDRCNNLFIYHLTVMPKPGVFPIKE